MPMALRRSRPAMTPIIYAVFAVVSILAILRQCHVGRIFVEAIMSIETRHAAHGDTLTIEAQRAKTGKVIGTVASVHVKSL